MERNKKPIDVWWDMENAPVPYDCPDSEICGRILGKLRENFFGRVRIRGVVAYSDSLKRSQKKRIYKGRLHKMILKIGEVHKFQRPEGSTDNQVALTKILDITKNWLERGNEPRYVMFITGNNRFTNNRFTDTLKKLKKHGHTILLAYAENPHNPTSTEIRRFADYQWFWREFLSLPISIPKKIEENGEEDEEGLKKKKREVEALENKG